jgi:hypothetical protein
MPLPDRHLHGEWKSIALNEHRYGILYGILLYSKDKTTIGFVFMPT